MGSALRRYGNGTYRWICGILIEILFADGTNVKLALRGHTGWVASVAWSPKSEYTLCTGSYDATVRVWDIRSKGPLYTVNAEDDSSDKKTLSVDWSGDQILCGGEDKKLQIFKTNTH